MPLPQLKHVPSLQSGPWLSGFSEDSPDSLDDSFASPDE
jgi:hypothetical protein